MRLILDIEKLLTFRVSMLHHKMSVGSVRPRTLQHGLVLREWRVLAFLAKYQPMKASDLVARSPMDKASVSRAVATLTRRGLVESKALPGDRRARRLSLTAKGKKLFQKVAPDSRARHAKLVSVLTVKEREAFFQMIDKLMAQLGKLDG